jgi:MFS transporter, PPP family, 3-phenylpropionic acid transporter
MLPYWRLSAYYFSYFAFIGAFSPYFGLYYQSLGFSAWDIGVLMSLLQVMRLVAPNIWGWLAERLGARMPIVRFAAAMSILGFGVLFFTERFVGIFVGMTVLAFFWGAALPLTESVTLSHLGGQSSGYGKIRVWGSVGFILAVLGCGYLLDLAPVRILLWVTLGTLVGITVSALAVPDAAPRQHDSDHWRLREILRRPEVTALLIACFAMSAAHGTLYVFYSIYLVDHGYGKALVGWLWTVGVLAEIGAFLAMPALLRLFSLRAILLFSLGCAVVRFGMIGWGVDSLVVLLVAQILHGATFGAYHASAVATVNLWFGGRHQARGQAIYSSVSFGAGGMVGGLVSGYMWEGIGPALTFTVSSAFALAGLVFLAVAFKASLPAAQTEA